MTSWLLVAVAAGGFVGAPVRYLADRFVAGRAGTDFPLGTWAVNVAGALLLGLLSGLAIRHRLPSGAQALAGTGFCGAFTTFSTWSFETVRLVEAGELVRAFVNAAASLVVGLAAAGAGIALGLLG